MRSLGEVQQDLLLAQTLYEQAVRANADTEAKLRELANQVKALRLEFGEIQQTFACPGCSGAAQFVLPSQENERPRLLCGGRSWTDGRLVKCGFNTTAPTLEKLEQIARV